MYWDNIEHDLSNLAKLGYVKLPPLQNHNVTRLASVIINECRHETFSTASETHINFLNTLGLFDQLAPRLYELAVKEFDYRGDIDNQYHVARFVEPGNSTEQYRAHFDSHLFTLVLPMQIPKGAIGGETGDLIFFPKLRRQPSNEAINIAGKIYYKRYASKKGIEKLSATSDMHQECFRDMRPILFIGNTTLHTNRSVSLNCTEGRLTLLAHFFDPSPKYGVGNLLRLIRKR